MIKEYKAYYKSEIGLIEIKGTRDGISSLNFVEKESMDNFEIPPCLKECVKQLDEYFKGKRKEFSVNLLLQGSNFQKKVWRELIKIPFGETVSYMGIALSIGNKKAVRAVGNAAKRNKIAIIIPCHRVIGSDGSLSGYAGRIWRKKWLLKHERDGSRNF